MKPHKSKELQSYAIKETPRNKNRETLKCQICEGQQDIEECTTILEQAVEDKSKTIYKKRLCYGCLEGLSKEHVDILQYYMRSKLRKRNQREEPVM